MSVLNVLKREIRRILEEPIVWFLTVIIPIAMCFVICQIFSAGSPQDLPVAVLNQDNSELSRLFVRNIDSLSSCAVKYRVTSLEEGKNLLTEGKAYGFIVIPCDFQTDIYKLKQPSLVFYYNNQMLLVGGVVSKDVTSVVYTMMVGIDAKMRSKKGLPLEVAVKRATPVVVDYHVRSNPYLNYQYFLSFVAFGHILQILVIFVSIWAFGTEFKYGTTKKWLKTAGNSIVTAVVGKILPYFVIFSITFAIIYFMYFIVFQAPFEGSLPFVIFTTIVFIITCLSLGILFMSINGNFRYALSNAAFYSAMGFAFAGVTFPLMQMPVFAKIYSSMLPLTHFIKIMLDQTLRVIPVFWDWHSVGAMLIIFCVAVLTMPRLKKLAQDENRWFQI